MFGNKSFTKLIKHECIEVIYYKISIILHYYNSNMLTLNVLMLYFLNIEHTHC